MPILKNARHERFAQALAKGEKATRAYVDAGFKPNRHNAAFLGQKQHILERVSEILAKFITKDEASVERMAQRLGNISLARVTDWVKVVKGKVILADSDTIPEQIADAVAGIKPTKDGIEVKFHDPQVAINLLGKHRGMFKENVNLTVTLSLADLVNASYQPDPKLVEAAPEKG